MKTEARKVYSRIFWIFLPNIIKIDSYNFEVSPFKVCAFFLRHSVVWYQYLLIFIGPSPRQRLPRPGGWQAWWRWSIQCPMTAPSSQCPCVVRSVVWYHEPKSTTFTSTAYTQHSTANMYQHISSNAWIFYTKFGVVFFSKSVHWQVDFSEFTFHIWNRPKAKSQNLQPDVIVVLWSFVN